MKRALLIAGGTVGGLGAVLAITPPQLTSTQDVGSLSGNLGGGTAATTQPTATQAAAPAKTTAAQAAPTKSTATKSATTKSKATKKAVATKSAQATSKPAATTPAAAPATSAPAPTPTPTPTQTKAAPATSTGGFTGTVTGGTYNARNYGNLSATVTFSNGQITRVSASQSPSSWSQNSLSALIPYVNGGKITIEQIKQYSASQLPCSTQNSCRSQASFTAEAFWSSVKSAINKAGL